MHDPMRQAFEIKCWWGKSPWGYYPPLITIWHVDPEKDGTDDSCGWSHPKLSKDQKRRIETLAADEASEPWFQAFHGKKIDSPTEAETLVRQALFLIGRVFSKQHICEPPIKPVSFEEASAWACDLLCSPVDNLRSSLAFLPGWHSNNDQDRERDRQYTAERFFFCIARYTLGKRRPWWRHPKWHIHHWEIQIHPLQQFKRWAFSKCATCGRGFQWGERGYTNTWNSTGPQWFRSEEDLHHMNCQCTSANVKQEPVTLP